MSWLVSAKQYIPAVIGEPFGGGFFAGYISHTADGNATHALIVAPRATGATGSGYTLATKYPWKLANTTTAGTTSDFDGAANTAAMVAAGINDHPAAKFCVDLNIGGFTDWHLPSRFELDIAYFNLKPGTQTNNTNSGVNIYSVPRRTRKYSAGYPTQTSLTAFNTASQGFTDNQHWSSTESNELFRAWYLMFSSGVQNPPGIGLNIKTTGNQVRAFRRIAL
jgi:hypothetical protein